MEALMAGAVGVLVACGVYLLLRARTYPVILGIMLLGYAVNLFLVASGRLSVRTPPIIRPGAGAYADPLPQALVLTAIVIGFGMAAFVVVLALRAALAAGSDHVDGAEPAAGAPGAPGAPDLAAAADAADITTGDEEPAEEAAAVDAVHARDVHVREGSR